MSFPKLAGSEWRPAWQRDEGLEAWAFLFHDSGPWLQAARVLVYSLNKLSSKKRDIVALVLAGKVSEADLDTLRSTGVIIHIIDWVDNAMFSPAFDVKMGPAWVSRLNHTMAKLRAWQLEKYQKVVLIDLDILPISSIEVLFDLPVLSAAPYEGWPCGQVKLPWTNAPWINLGIINLQPSNTTYNRMMATMTALARKIDNVTDPKAFDRVHTIFAVDQGFLNYFFKETIYLLPYTFLDPAEGGCFKVQDFYQNGTDGRCELGSHTKAIHYTGDGKPWNAKPQWGSQKEVFTRIPLDQFTSTSDCRQYRRQRWWQRFYELEAADAAALEP